MNILVDADACPVIDSIIDIADKYKISVILFTDTNHIFTKYSCKVITVDSGRDSVDIALVNKTSKGDIIVTQDYGLASLALGKKALVVNQNGLIYTDDNIDQLLMQRHISQKIRKAGSRTSNPRKRTAADDEAFASAFEKICKFASKKEE